MDLKLISVVIRIFLANAAAIASAQTISFLPHRDIAIGPNCCALAAGDFNGDGKTDLIVGYGQGNLALMLGDGTGSFKPKTELATFIDPIDNVVAVDINHDGRLDLLVGIGALTNTTKSRTYVLFGHGNGTFDLPSFIADSGIPLVIADFNGDGVLDLGLHAYPLDVFPADCDGLQIWLGTGAGAFRNATCTAGPDLMIHEAATADFNGDGVPDLAWDSFRSGGAIWLFLGNGDGTFRRAPYPSGLDARSGNPRVIATADLNHDGKPDVIVGNGGLVAVFLGNGDGTFQFATSTSGTPNYLYSYYSFSTAAVSPDVLIADMNSDGNPDIVTHNYVLLGNGDGTFKPAQYLLTGSTNPAPQIVADLNGDRRPDIIYVDYVGDNGTATGLSILLNDTPGLPSSVTAYNAATGSSPISPGSIASIFGKDLAATTAAASGSSLPTQLGGISLRIRDLTDTVRLAPLIYVSPTQINFLVPDQTAIGPASLTIDNGSSIAETANATPITPTAPGIFSANGKGDGPAAATAIRILADGTQQPVDVFKCPAPGQCTLVPIDLHNGQPVYLSLYGTGFRNDPDTLRPWCTIGGIDIVAQFRGPQPTGPGLDQINLLVPQTLPSGTVTVQCNLSFPIGSPTDKTNPVQIQIQ